MFDAASDDEVSGHAIDELVLDFKSRLGGLDTVAVRPGRSEFKNRRTGAGERGFVDPRYET